MNETKAGKCRFSRDVSPARSTVTSPNLIPTLNILAVTGAVPLISHFRYPAIRP